MKTIAIYSGRFQPFHKGHYSAYQTLVDKFGEDNVYIGTSDPVEPDGKNPFNFAEKKHLMHGLFNIPSERVVQVKNPYQPKEILSKFDPKDTTFVTAVGEKDGDRLSHGKYFKQYKDGEETVPYENGGYFITVPNFKVDDEVMSATKIRDKFSNPAVSTKEKIDFFKQLYGKFDPKLFKTVQHTIQSRSDQPNMATGAGEEPSGPKTDPAALTKKVHNPVTRRDILVKTALNYDKDHPVYKLAKKMFQKGPVTEIFGSILIENALINQYNSLVDQFISGEGKKKECRIDAADSHDEIERKCKNAYKNGVFYYPLVYALRTSNDDPENFPEEEPTSTETLPQNDEVVQEQESSTARVRKYYKKHPEKVRKYLKKTQSERVARNRDRAKAVKKHGKAKMKNHDVHHPNGTSGSWQLAKKDHGRDKVNEDFLVEAKMLLTCGGAGGHMMHPYEDTDLSFGQYKDMINMALVGDMGAGGEPTEKLDGQNVAFSVIDGEVKFARNKGHVKNAGRGAMSVQDVMKKFQGRGDIQRAFVGAAKDLQAAARSLPDDQVDGMFGGGKKFMSLEIIFPETTNVIPYNKSVLVFHGTIEYDRDGNKVNTTPEDAKTFSDQLTKVGQHKQKVFGLQGPHVISFNDVDTENMQKKTQQYNAEIDQLREKYGLQDDDPVNLYYRKWWADELKTELGRAGIEVNDDALNGLINRFAFDDKGMKSKDFANPRLRQWLKDYQSGPASTTRLRQAQKKSKAPFEMIFLKAGSESLKRIQNFLGANNPAAVQELQKELDIVKQALRGGELEDVAEKLNMEFERLDQIGIDNMVPSEGIVFFYNGAPYKLTGAFAPINQILGTFKFGTTSKPETPRTSKGQPEEPTSTPQGKPEEPTNPRGQPDDTPQDMDFIKQYYDVKIKNPETEKDITIKSALTYDKTSPVYKSAVQFLKTKMKK